TLLLLRLASTHPFPSQHHALSLHDALPILCNCCYLNLLWLICSIPIFTIGASTSALYSVTLKIARNEDVIIHRQFFKAFRENFRSEDHTSELQSRFDLVCRLLLEKTNIFT